MDDANRRAKITDNIINILSLDHTQLSFRWFGYDNDTGILDVDSNKVDSDSKILIEHRCVECGCDQIFSARAFLVKLADADTYCQSCCDLHPQ
jgi:hypothetical protein